MAFTIAAALWEMNDWLLYVTKGNVALFFHDLVIKVRHGAYRDINANLGAPVLMDCTSASERPSGIIWAFDVHSIICEQI